MIEELCKPEVQRFIEEHQNESVEQLLLKHHGSALPLRGIAEQIKSRQKYALKFPKLIKSGFLFPGSRAVEQASSEVTARFKTEITGGKRAVDLSGGLGIDALHLASKFDSVTYVERDPILCEFAAWNFTNLGLSNINVVNSLAEDFLINSNDDFDLVYLDPDRRSDSKRTFLIEEASPNVVEFLREIQHKTRTWLIKLSPMMDTSQAVSKLTGCSKVYLVAFNNELKELLIFGDDHSNNIEYFCVDIDIHTTTRLKIPAEGLNLKSEFSQVKRFIYEPSVTQLKLGAFGYLAENYNVKKLSENAHLFTSDTFVTSFPGRKYRVLEVLRPKKKTVMEVLNGSGAAIGTRDYPDNAESIRQKYRIPEGDIKKLFFTRVQDGSYKAILTERIEESNQSEKRE